MGNFDYLDRVPAFRPFVQAAKNAEQIFPIDPDAAMIQIRKSVELVLQTFCKLDGIPIPIGSKGVNPSLADYLNYMPLREELPARLKSELNQIRIMGNMAAHTSESINPQKVIAAFQILFLLMDWMAYSFTPEEAGIYQKGRKFNQELLKAKPTSNIRVSREKELEDEIRSQKEELKRLKEQLAGNTKKQRQDYVFQPPEWLTRKLFIDTMLENAGWTKGKDWLEEFEVSGMPTKSGKGKIDYVLTGKDGVPLAIIEAKKTSREISEGRQQAKLYADSLEKKYGRRPVIFLSNGFENAIIDGEYPERSLADFYSQRDLEKLFTLRTLKQSLVPSHPDEKIAGRYYQKAAIEAVCDLLEQKKRKALLVMATGSGKTRTAVALIDLLIKKNWVTNVLFLADRSILVSQAKEAISNLLPNLSVTDLTKDKANANSRVVVSTYQTMINCIDDTADERGRIFTPGHFDLIICDEVHRSIYNKYGDIFNYFDAPIIGLTATPKDEVDRNTYKLFEREDEDPTYAYSLEQGVKDGFLVDYQVVKTGTKFLETGITYDDLNEKEKEDYEEQFEDEEGILPYHQESSKINTVIFNKGTIREVLGLLMKDGLRVDYGEKIGKTIIFAQNHRHAEEILKVFKEEYPYLGDDYAQVIDYRSSYDAELLKKQFANPNTYPQIAISVDMMDTGVDIPAVLNLVFFKRVRSKTKFWQMIGRGTRLCEKLIDGKDKDKFLIFDFLGNFDFFKTGKKEFEPTSSIPIQGALFTTKLEMIYKLQEDEYQTKELQQYRDELIEDLTRQVDQLNRKAFNVHQHLKLVQRYANVQGYKHLTLSDIKAARKELAHLINPLKDDIQAIRFDALMFRMEKELLYGKVSKAVLRDLKQKAADLKKYCLDNPAVRAQKPLILKCLDDSYLESLSLYEMEKIRKELRTLIKYIPKEEVQKFVTDYEDTLIDPKYEDPSIKSMDLTTYKERAESYIREHEDLEAIRKLKNNEQLTNADMKSLEEILWGEIGTKADYEAALADKPLGKFVRSVTGLSPKAAKEAFAAYIDEANLNSDQINFVNQIIEYLIQNGTIEKKAMMESPFTDRGSLSDIFRNRIEDWLKISHTIDEVNERALH